MAVLTLSLFDDEPEPVAKAPDSNVQNLSPVAKAPFSGDEKSVGTPEAEVIDLSPGDNFALAADRPEPHTPFDWAVLRPERQPATVADAHPLAFVAVCRAAGIEHPALTPIATDPSGARRFEAKPLQRLANLILRGVESDRPEVTPERWREAGGKAAAWWAERKVAA